jgi:uncharacterized protein (TIGR00255 family)
VEIKTVNHRYLNTQLRTPPGFDRLEHEVQKWIRPFLARGHVNLAVTFERGEGAIEDRLPELDLDRARRYHDLLGQLRDGLGVPGDINLDAIARFGEIFRAPEPQRHVDLPNEIVREVIEEAAKSVLGMREAEGQRIDIDLRGRLDAMSAYIDEIEARAPERLVAERDRLRTAIQDLIDREDVDEDRLARELAYLAEKWDISEEVVRFRSHITMFSDTLGSSTTDGVGKRLGFIVQEMHREANTIGSKANDVTIARAAVGVKEELERLREQLENVE